MAKAKTKIVWTCPHHGATSMKRRTKGRIELRCGCVWTPGPIPKGAVVLQSLPGTLTRKRP